MSTPPIRHICAFCGSSSGRRPEYAAAARALGGLLAGEGVGLVYGGGATGIMGEIADAVLARGGEVIGVIPRHLEDRELAHRGLSDLRVVGSMHERKALMEELADAFVALPGGLGTLEELFEIATWNQLGIVDKPMGLLNVLGYFDPMISFLDRAVEEGFVRPQDREILCVAEDPPALIAALRSEPRAGRQKLLGREER